MQETSDKGKLKVNSYQLNSYQLNTSSDLLFLEFYDYYERVRIIKNFITKKNKIKNKLDGCRNFERNSLATSLKNQKNSFSNKK